jgi:hypothetical protein
MTTLELIGKQLKALEQAQQSDASKKLEAFEGLLAEISTALSDLVAVAEGKKPEPVDDSGVIAAIESLAESLAEAMRGMRIEAPKVELAAPVVHVAAPEVVVNVPAAQIKNDITVPPAQVHVVERQRVKHWKVDHKYFGGVIESSILTPVYEGTK